MGNKHTTPKPNPRGRARPVEDTNSPVLQLPGERSPQIARAVNCAKSELLYVLKENTK